MTPFSKIAHIGEAILKTIYLLRPAFSKIFSTVFFVIPSFSLTIFAYVSRLFLGKIAMYEHSAYMFSVIRPPLGLWSTIQQLTLLTLPLVRTLVTRSAIHNLMVASLLPVLCDNESKTSSINSRVGRPSRFFKRLIDRGCFIKLISTKVVIFFFLVLGPFWDVRSLTSSAAYTIRSYRGRAVN